MGAVVSRSTDFASEVAQIPALSYRTQRPVCPSQCPSQRHFHFWEGHDCFFYLRAYTPTFSVSPWGHGGTRRDTSDFHGRVRARMSLRVSPKGTRHAWEGHEASFYKLSLQFSSSLSPRGQGGGHAEGHDVIVGTKSHEVIVGV